MKRILRIILVVSFVLTQCVGAKAAIGSTTIWHVRVGGSNTNGGGYDSAISGATTDYTDQDAAQLTVTDIVTIGGTTVTSVTGGFTSAMIGNCLRIVGDGYYFITARASSNSITVDRNTGTAVAQTGSVGGAFGGSTTPFTNFWNGGTIAQPAITSPLAPGHIVYIRGSGSNDPTSDDYTMPASDYSSLPNGDLTTGRIKIIGYNGRPRINYSGLAAYQSIYISIENLSLFLNASATYRNYGFFNIGAGGGSAAINCKVDTNGVDQAVGLSVTTAIGNHILNTGTTSAGSSSYGIDMGTYGGAALGNLIENQRSTGIHANSSISSFVGNIIVNNANYGMLIDASGGTYGNSIIGNTIYGNGSDGLHLNSADSLNVTFVNNILSNNGGYGASLSTAAGDKIKVYFDYNDYFMNSSGAYNNITAGTHDLAIDPQFVNASGGDFSIGTNLKALGYPSIVGGGTTTSYVDIGGAQRQESGGGAAATTGFTFVQ